jgi:hypothetical protein
MKAVWIIAGIVLLLAGLAWMVYIVGGVFSQPPLFSTLDSGLWGAMAFHAVTTGLGTFCLGRAVGKRQAAPA